MGNRRNIILKKIIAFLMLGIFSIKSYALTGMDLIHLAQSPHLFYRNQFDSYIIGYYDGYIKANRLTILGWLVENSSFIAKKIAKRPRTIVCDATDVTYEQIILIVRKYLENNPKELNEQASDLIVKALDGAFPCKYN